MFTRKKNKSMTKILQTPQTLQPRIVQPTIVIFLELFWMPTFIQTVTSYNMIHIVCHGF